MRHSADRAHMTAIAAAGLLAFAGSSVAASLVPGVEIAPDGTTVVAMRPAAGIVAVAAESGRPLWTSDAGDRPLIVADGEVLAQVETFTPGHLGLAVLGLQDGAARASLDVPIDAAVRARVSDGLEDSFGIRAVAASGQRFLIWDYVSRRVQGTPPAPGTGGVARHGGALAVDLRAATAVVIDAGEVPPDESPPPPVGFRQLVAGAQLIVEPVRSGPVWAAVAARPGPGDATSLVLERWDAAADEALDEVVLWTGRPLHVWPTVGAEIVLVAARTHLGEWQEYTWSGFQLATGGDVGQVRSPVARAPAAMLAGGLLLTVRPPAGRRLGGTWNQLPRRLVALDPAAGGGEAWTLPLRDLVFRGSFPP